MPKPADIADELKAKLPADGGGEGAVISTELLLRAIEALLSRGEKT